MKILERLNSITVIQVLAEHPRVEQREREQTILQQNFVKRQSSQRQISKSSIPLCKAYFPASVSDQLQSGILGHISHSSALTT